MFKSSRFNGTLVTPLLCTLPKYFYYGSMWAGTFEDLMNGVYKEAGSFIVQKQ